MPAFAMGRRGSLSSGAPDASNLQLLALPSGPFYQDSSRALPAGVGDPVGSWTDILAGAQHLAGTGTTRPVLRAGGVSFAEDSVSDVLLSAASALSTGWSLYVRCEATTGASGILAAESPVSASVPLVNIYPSQTYFSVSSSFAPLVADAGGDKVRGMSLSGTTLTGFIGETEGTATVTPQGIAALSVGAVSADWYRGAVKAVAFYRGGHDATTRAAVRTYLMGL